MNNKNALNLIQQIGDKLRLHPQMEIHFIGISDIDIEGIATYKIEKLQEIDCYENADGIFVDEADIREQLKNDYLPEDMKGDEAEEFLENTTFKQVKPALFVYLKQEQG